MQLGGVDHITPDMQRAWFTRLASDPSKAYFTAFVIQRGDQEAPVAFEGDFLGVVRMDEIDRHNRSARIGADVEPSRRGQGWGTAIYRMLLRYCFDHLGLHRVHLAVLDTNEIGRRLYRNVGFIEEGRYREAIWRDGSFHDYIIMSVLEHEYRRRTD
jgi:RimJ/RimL family protein N-acetyltransferase